jgi:hypothetical protein
MSMSAFTVSNSVMRVRPLLLALAIVGADASGVLLSQERPLPFARTTTGLEPGRSSSA